MALINIENDDQWRLLRTCHIGGSDVAALFGLSPYATKWQLWMEKVQRLPPENLDDNKAVQAGKFLEAGIAGWASARWGMELTKVNAYATCDGVVGMGATLDYVSSDGAPVEIKWSARGHGWEYQGEDILAAPDNYILQCQHQMACFGGDHAWLVALINNEPRRMYVPRNDDIIEAIKSACVEFWFSVQKGEVPDPDFVMDADAIGRLMGDIPLSDVELSSDAAALFDEYAEASTAEKDATDRKAAAKSQLLLLAMELMAGRNTSGEKAIVRCGERRMTITPVAPNPGKRVTEDMVGTVIGPRKGYQLVRIS